MNKYIIRNCPAFVLMRTATSGIYFNMCGIAKGHTHCKDNTDCLLKQIVNVCKMDMSDDDLKYILEHKNDEGVIWLTDSQKAILNTLKLLEIEEADDQRLYDLQ